jgi:glycosyltransferase involved in cell wall biosynthesis
MSSVSHEPPEICVVGRTDHSSGIGKMTFSACAMLSRSFPVSIFPTDYASRSLDHVTLPNGGSIPVCKDPSRIKVWFFADVLWNGVRDFNYLLVGKGLRVAQIVFDSTEIPYEWVSILNERFDVVLVTSTYMMDVVRRSGVNIPVGTLPIALDNESLLSRPFVERPESSKISFISIGAFHPRKCHEIVVRAFAETFGNDENVDLQIHSNLAFEDSLDRLKHLVERLDVKNIRLTREHLSDRDAAQLIENADVYINCSQGEGYSIGARDALALGKPLVLSETGAHLDLMPTEGVFGVPANIRVPARYPEIDHRVIGSQHRVASEDISAAMKSAVAFVKSGNATATRSLRRALASQSSFGKLWSSYAEVIDPDYRAARARGPKPKNVDLPEAIKSKSSAKPGGRARLLAHKRNVVIPVHDGGYYSIFNCFFSNLVWNLQDARLGWTLPDWDAGRFLERRGGNRVDSFCYGGLTDGNFWTKLYAPLFGLTEKNMNDADYLYEGSFIEDPPWNVHREPLLTHVNAYQLYRSADFQKWRKWYNRAYQDHIKLAPTLDSEIESFVGKNFGDKFIVAAHVRHPSHAIEQPGGRVAATNYYINEVRNQIARQGLREMDDSWGVFLATDQDKVTRQFVEAFGEKVFFFSDVRRTRDEEDEAYLSGSAEAQGHQVQHIVAANSENWSTRMAEEIIRDATVMSRSNVLIHIVSNVSTAVSYMNPDIKLVLAEPNRAVSKW